MGRVLLAFLLRMLPAMAVAVPVVAVCRWIQVPRLRARGLATTLCHEAGLWVFLLFLAGLAALTIVPQEWRWVGLSQARVNLVPFRVFRESAAIHRATGSWGYFVINVVGNIVMFMPLGFFPCLLWEDQGRGLLRGTGWALFASLCVELCQLPQDRGTDVDDLWLNALGGAMGFLLYWLLKRLWPGLPERFRLKKRTSSRT